MLSDGTSLFLFLSVFVPFLSLCRFLLPSSPFLNPSFPSSLFLLSSPSLLPFLTPPPPLAISHSFFLSSSFPHSSLPPFFPPSLLSTFPPSLPSSLSFPPFSLPHFLPPFLPLLLPHFLPPLPSPLPLPPCIFANTSLRDRPNAHLHTQKICVYTKRSNGYTHVYLNVLLLVFTARALRGLGGEGAGQEFRKKGGRQGRQVRNLARRRESRSEIQQRGADGPETQREGIRQVRNSARKSQAGQKLSKEGQEGQEIQQKGRRQSETSEEGQAGQKLSKEGKEGQKFNKREKAGQKLSKEGAGRSEIQQKGRRAGQKLSKEGQAGQKLSKEGKEGQKFKQKGRRQVRKLSKEGRQVRNSARKGKKVRNSNKKEKAGQKLSKEGKVRGRRQVRTQQGRERRSEINKKGEGRSETQQGRERRSEIQQKGRRQVRNSARKSPDRSETQQGGAGRSEIQQKREKTGKLKSLELPRPKVSRNEAFREGSPHTPGSCYYAYNYFCVFKPRKTAGECPGRHVYRPKLEVKHASSTPPDSQQCSRHFVLQIEGTESHLAEQRVNSKCGCNRNFAQGWRREEHFRQFRYFRIAPPSLRTLVCPGHKASRKDDPNGPSR
ncbi:hypothetical protein C7M84_009851 [Penaeus vannamei]|uniref:Uncharacterized protein n=1 Tax=Penaeus vannamei TaxID=6689 RepID=A0A423T5W5_PENVA|nr:hypothetical protein C7M84_009851 [Penaeus vannamei]